MPVTFPVAIKTLKVSGGPKRTVYFPRVVGLSNRDIEKSINQNIVLQAQQLINQQVGNMPETVEEMLGSYEIKNNQRDVLSLTQSNYTYHRQAAHGMTYLKSLTFDMKSGRMYELKDLFKPGSDYVKRLSEIVEAQIKNRSIPLLEDFKGISEDQDFYIADKSLVLYFQLYELTPYAYGFPMFPISVYELEGLIDEDGPLGRMASA
ncbi:DUF3298 and DUF4163 domain-containing protein [Mesobacillus subterraneus]|uniref:DUF3298 domain-containing protein n=1 Tax=Mesobacillus subterraneus TaxID=285983 RepID=A0A427THG8_9BACI|nr:DUF3298 and DUF4163 domain-containing protein [Mesobacillus subterraneus]RSD22326.1 DUF3298 domain-containing protein [Mesobacillus subterraneus]